MQAPPYSRFSWKIVADKLVAIFHEVVRLDSQGLDVFVIWGRRWWTRLFQPHENDGQPYSALWFCSPESQQREIIRFLETNCSEVQKDGVAGLARPSSCIF